MKYRLIVENMMNLKMKPIEGSFGFDISTTVSTDSLYFRLERKKFFKWIIVEDYSHCISLNELDLWIDVYKRHYGVSDIIHRWKNPLKENRKHKIKRIYESD